MLLSMQKELKRVDEVLDTVGEKISFWKYLRDLSNI